MDVLELNNQIAQLIVDFIAYIPTIGEFDPSNKRPNKDFIPILELANLNYTLHPNDHSSQLNITLRNTTKEEEFNIFLQNRIGKYVQGFIEKLTQLTGLHQIPVSNTQLKIYQHPRMGDILTYYESDFNYYITYSQYLD